MSCSYGKGIVKRLGKNMEILVIIVFQQSQDQVSQTKWLGPLKLVRSKYVGKVF